jgi:hypothetical protein
MPLQNATAITEGARMQRLMNSCQPKFIPRLGNPEICGPCGSGSGSGSGSGQSIQYPITQSENSKTMLLMVSTNGTLLNGGGVTQARARQLLTTATQLNVQSMRTLQLQQLTLAASSNALDPTSRFSQYTRPSMAPPCPPYIPPPPAPPLSACIPKNMRLGS